jgi:hypothetical protein
MYNVPESNTRRATMRRVSVLVLIVGGLLCGPVLQPAAVAEAQTRQRAKAVLWKDPGRVERLDFQWGPGGRALAPAPPFRFIEEDKDGTNAKIKVRDAKGRRWSIKWDDGGEANAEIIATRIVWAAGYFVEPSYFVRRGRILGVRGLDRAAKFVSPNGTFTNGRFELKYETVAEREDEESWRWDQNPFVGTRELNGLKIVTMLVSNWDNKDASNRRAGSNTAVHVVRGRSGLEARYLVTDWGGAMGKWGGFFSREKWDCPGYLDQTAKFVEVKDGEIDWGFKGQHTNSFKEDIRLADVRWVMRYLGRITDAQLRAGLVASGASPAEVRCYQRGLRSRIEQLRRLAAAGEVGRSR